MFGRGKHSSPSLSDLLDMDDRTVNKLIKSGQVPTFFKSAKNLRKAAKNDRKETERCVSGESGVGALAAILAGAKGGGTGNRRYQDIPLRDRVHPAEYKRILEREAKRQGLL